MSYDKNPNELGALWTKTGAKGDYMTGTINGQRVVVFKNHRKQSEKGPDWRVLKAQERERPAPEPVEPPDDSGIPF